MRSTRCILLSEVSATHLSSSATPLAVYTGWRFQPPCVQCAGACLKQLADTRHGSATQQAMACATQAGLPCQAPSAGSRTAWCTPLPAVPAYRRAPGPAGKGRKGGLGVGLGSNVGTARNTQQLSMHGHLPPPTGPASPASCSSPHLEGCGGYRNERGHMVHRHLGPSKGGIVHHQQQQICGKVAQLQHWGGGLFVSLCKYHSCLPRPAVEKSERPSATPHRTEKPSAASDSGLVRSTNATSPICDKHL